MHPSDDPISHIIDIRPDVISGASYPIDRDSIAVGYCIWKILLQKVRAAQLPLPHAKKILPVVITMWNRAKGRIDEMTRHLDSMLFDFSKGTPKQRLVIREIMKLALSVYFAKRHCFPSKTVPKGQGYTKIQSHLWHLGKGFTVKEVLYQLATTYTVRNKILGRKLGSPMPGTEDSDDGVGSSLTQREISSCQSKAFSYVRSIREKRNKFKLFCKDETLAHIRTDRRLIHTIVASHANSSVKKNKPTKEGAKTYNYPRCVLCTALVGSPYAKHSAYACRTCGVALCIKRDGQKKKSCFEKWHSVSNIEGLLKNNSVRPECKSVQTSPKKRAKLSTSGLFTTSGGLRRSTRKHSTPSTQTTSESDLV